MKLMRQKLIYNFILICSLLMLSGCSVWKDDFDEPIVRANPKSSIHEISTLVDKGIIKEEDNTETTITPGVNTTDSRGSFFSDGNVSRGFEEVRRIYLTSYEDQDKNLHADHHLYVVVKPAVWNVSEGSKK